MRRALAYILVTIGLAVLDFVILLSVTNHIGTNGPDYCGLQMKSGVSERIGISTRELLRLDEALGHYLQSDEVSELDHLDVELNGEVRQAFNEREISHMRDVQALFILLRRVRNILLPCGAVMLVAGLLIGWHAFVARWIRCVIISLVVFAVPLLAVVFWAVADFDSAFTAMHHVLFTNDLWLLDPQTDLMIHMMPAGFFASLGRRIALQTLGWVTCLNGLIILGKFAIKEK